MTSPSPEQYCWEIVPLPSTGGAFDGDYLPSNVDEPGSETVPSNVDKPGSETVPNNVDEPGSETIPFNVDDEPGSVPGNVDKRGSKTVPNNVDEPSSEIVPVKVEPYSDMQIVPYVLDAQPIGQGVPLNSKKRKSTSSDGAQRSTRIDRRSIEFHLRPAWLPVGWVMWKAIRVGGKSVGHVDVYYYSPDGNMKCRSKKDLFYYLITGTKRPAKLKITHTPVELEFDVPELETWYGPEAGVTVTEATPGDEGTKIYPENYEFAGQLILMKLPIGMKRVRVPAGTLYSAIGRVR